MTETLAQAKSSINEQNYPPFLRSSTSNSLQPLGETVQQCPMVLKRPSVPTAMDRHLKYIKTLQKKRREQLQGYENAEKEAQERIGRVMSFSQKLRRKILEGEDVSDTWKPVKEMHTQKHIREQTSHPTISTVEREECEIKDLDPEQVSQEMEQLVDDALLQLEEQQKENLQNTYNSVDNSLQTSSQPLDVTQEEGKKQQGGVDLDENIDMQDVDDLLSFAEDLDYDTMLANIDDEDLRQQVQVLYDEGQSKQIDSDTWKTRFTHLLNQAVMQHKQKTFKKSKEMSPKTEANTVVNSEKEGGSEKTSKTRRSKVVKKEDNDWDSSTVLDADCFKQRESKDAMSEATEVLRDLPNLGNIHSQASVKSVMDSLKNEIQ